MNLRPLLLLFGLLSFVWAQLEPTGSAIGLDSDPYLQYRPPFLRSLPIQILIVGIVITLVVILLFHLLFTVQYHWPLAPVNYALQLSCVIILFISLIATLHVVLSTTMVESQHWPYMLSYIAVNVPPLNVQHTGTGWTVAERVTWLVMNASASGLIQITHIHFLTILYPSRLEGRLILTLLVPLAVLSAVMQLIPIEGIESNRQSVLVASAVHNVCSATLSLLFTTALFLWGFLVNRRQAWRTDGGTAAFGTAALTLAVFSTTLNFIYVDRQVEYVWLPSLLWTVILWQSFLGWWWWVGAGSGSGLLYGSESIEIEERLKMQENREMKKRETKERRREAGMRARKVFKNMTGAFGRSNDNDSDKNTVTNVSSTTTAIDGPISQSSQNDRRRYRRDQRSPAGNGHETEFINVEPETVFSASSVTGTPTSQDSKPRYIPDFLFRWYASLRHAHQAAARAQDAERVERIRGLGRNHPIRMGGWGFGGFGWRAAREWCAEAEINGDAWKRHSLRRQGDEFEMHDNSRPLRSTLEGMSSEETLSSRIEPTGSTALPKDSADQPPSDQTFPPSVPPPTHHGSIWWWGPLRRWRLQDSTTY